MNFRTPIRSSPQWRKGAYFPPARLKERFGIAELRYVVTRNRSANVGANVTGHTEIQFLLLTAYPDSALTTLVSITDKSNTLAVGAGYLRAIPVSSKLTSAESSSPARNSQPQRVY